MRKKTIEESICWIMQEYRPMDLSLRHALLEYQPGNGSRYVISFTRVPDGIESTLGCHPGSFIVSLVDGELSGRCCILAPDGYLSPVYMAEKLRLGVKSQLNDIMVLTEIIGHILGRPTPSAQDKKGPFSPALQVEMVHKE
jgi:hypothetical protein